MSNENIWARNHIEIAERHESPPLVPAIVPDILISPSEYNRRQYIDAFERSRGEPPTAAAAPPLAPHWPCGLISNAHSMPCPLCPPRTLIAFTGLAGAGKSTAAAHLVVRRKFQRVRFAGPLKAMMAALGLTYEQIEGSEKETPCDLLGGKTPRWAMQSLGTEWGRDLIASDLWIRAWNAALAKVPAGMGVVVDDCRFPNEAAAVLSAGGVIVRIERPGLATGAGYKHSSETHQLPASRTLHNAQREWNLREQVNVLLTELTQEKTGS